jgi:AcrR family transcriptional regulator
LKERSIVRRKTPARKGRQPRSTDAASGMPAPNEAAAGSRANIIEVATQEFSEKGLSGARVDEIAERTSTSKRMIYYYFQSKEGLYRAVLERCYANVRQIDTSLDLDLLAPEEALRELVRVTFNYHSAHPEFVRIVMNENIHQGAHIGHVSNIKIRSRTIISMLQRLIDRGVKAGVFRSGLDPIDLHMSISALSFYNVSNRYTFGRVFQRDMSSSAAIARRRELVVEMIERWCRA